MLIFGGRLVHAAVAEARPERRPVYEKVLEKIYQSIGGYLGGLTLICLVNATLTTTFLAIDGVPFFLPLGLLAGLSSLVPYAGPLVAGTGHLAHRPRDQGAGTASPRRSTSSSTDSSRGTSWGRWSFGAPCT